MEEFRMARQSKREYLRSIYERYRRGATHREEHNVRGVLQDVRLQPEVCYLAAKPSFAQSGCSQTRKRALGYLQQASYQPYWPTSGRPRSGALGYGSDHAMSQYLQCFSPRE
jgi:hypothetical protein